MMMMKWARWSSPMSEKGRQTVPSLNYTIMFAMCVPSKALLNEIQYHIFFFAEKFKKVRTSLYGEIYT
jgi:hypothetical protein